VTKLLRELGCFEVSLGDTIGAGTPETVDRMLAAVLDIAPAAALAGHFHDTRSHALDNIEASLARGLRTFDAAAGGLGGCPYAPGAAGNVATGKAARLLQRLVHPTGVNLAKLDVAEQFARSLRETKICPTRP
jgi:hydroxymethylglutaryl-CoA lyase